MNTPSKPCINVWFDNETFENIEMTQEEPGYYTGRDSKGVLYEFWSETFVADETKQVTQ